MKGQLGYRGREGRPEGRSRSRKGRKGVEILGADGVKAHESPSGFMLDLCWFSPHSCGIDGMITKKYEKK